MPDIPIRHASCWNLQFPVMSTTAASTHSWQPSIRPGAISPESCSCRKQLRSLRRFRKKSFWKNLKVSSPDLILQPGGFTACKSLPADTVFPSILFHQFPEPFFLMLRCRRLSLTADECRCLSTFRNNCYMENKKKNCGCDGVPKKKITARGGDPERETLNHPDRGQQTVLP